MNYNWHDLRKNPNDLPKTGHRILLCTKNYDEEVEYWTGGLSEYGYYNDDCEDYYNHIEDDWVIAWKEIEPFEGV